MLIWATTAISISCEEPDMHVIHILPPEVAYVDLHGAYWAILVSAGLAIAFTIRELLR